MAEASEVDEFEQWLVSHFLHAKKRLHNPWMNEISQEEVRWKIHQTQQKEVHVSISCNLRTVQFYHFHLVNRSRFEQLVDEFEHLNSFFTAIAVQTVRIGISFVPRD